MFGQKYGRYWKRWLHLGGRKGLFGNLIWTLGLRIGKKWKGHLVVLMMGGILVTGFVGGGGVIVKIWQSVGSTLFCEPLGGMTTPCPVGRKMKSGCRPDNNRRREMLEGWQESKIRGEKWRGLHVFGRTANVQWSETWTHLMIPWLHSGEFTQEKRVYMSTKDYLKNVHSSLIYISLNLGTIQMFINRRMYKQTVDIHTMK